VYVNGVFDTEQQAETDKNRLQKLYGSEHQGQPITFQLGYNPTHLAGAGDLAQSAAQITGWFGGSLSNYDLDTILMQIYPEVATRKLLVVGHSQGALYGNEMYWYLTTHGEPAEAVGVYAVGTPGTMVAGDGAYINSDNDTVINLLRTIESNVLPANYYIPLVGADASSTTAGHSFVDAYLAGAPDKIVGDIDSELSGLKASDSGAGDCFTPPADSLGYKVQTVAFAVADPTSDVVKTGAIVATDATVAVAKSAYTLALGATQFLSDSIQVTTAPPTPQAAGEKNFEILKKLYGSSLDEQDYKDLAGSSSQGGAAIVATLHADEVPVEINGGFVEGTSTSLSTGTSTEFSASSSQVAAVFSTSTTPVATTTVATSSTPAIDPNFFNWTPGGGGAFAPALTDDSDTEDATATDTPADATTIDATAATSTPNVSNGLSLSDTFDSYDGSGWTVLQDDEGHYIYFTYDDNSDASCHSGGCIRADGGAGGLGTIGHTAYMYRDFDQSDSGAFTIWARAHKGWSSAAGSIGLCTNADCSINYQLSGIVAPQSDEAWHQYYIAWRQGANAVEICELMDNTNINNCAWNETSLSAGSSIQAVTLRGDTSRSDLGDHVWFDDLQPFVSGTATLTITNEVSNSNGGSASPQDFSVMLDGADASFGTMSVASGIHVVAQVPKLGYEVLYGGDCDSLGRVELAVGESKTCTLETSDVALLPALSDSFDADTLGTVAGQGSWIDAGGTNAWQVVADSNCESGQCVENGAINTGATFLAGASARSGIFSFDIMAPNDPLAGRPMSVNLSDAQGNEYAAGFGIVNGNAGFDIIASDGTTLFSNIALSVWHQFKLWWVPQENSCEAYVELDGSAPQKAGSVSCEVGGVEFFNALWNSSMYLDNVSSD